MPRLEPATDDGRAKLEAWDRRPKTARRLAPRSPIVPAAAGLGDTAVAADLPRRPADRHRRHRRQEFVAYLGASPPPPPPRPRTAWRSTS